jgi:phosphatidate cytidylyltransferase
MKTLLTRTLTGLLFVAVVVFAILSKPLVLLNVFLVFACIALYEYRSLWNVKQIYLSPLFFVIALLLYLFTGYIALWKIVVYRNIFPYLLLGLLLLLPIVELFHKKESAPLGVIAAQLGAMIFIVLPLALINHFLLIDQGKWILLAMFIMIWSYDTFAYCIGSLIGKYPLFQRISPKKSWEGSIGSAILTLVFAYFFSYFFPSVAITSWQWVAMGGIVVLMGTLGDLSESMFKRWIGVKDSGSILPGHGGILDRFDSLIFVAPFVLIYLHIIYTY